MGREFYYCFRRQTRLDGEDLDRGRAVRIREKVVCEKCVGDVIAPMSFKEQEEILLQQKLARDKYQEAARNERPKTSTSTRVRIPAAIRPPGSLPPPVKLPPSTSSNAGAVIFLMGALCLLAALGALYYTFGSHEYFDAAPPAPHPAPAPAEPVSVKVYKPEGRP